MGVSSGKPAMDVERASVSASLPSTMISMSALVPPMSKVISLRRSASPPIHAPASTPAANPESNVSVGFSDTMLAVATPPFEAMILRSALRPMLFSERSRWVMYIRTLGPIKAANAAVVKRSNSRNCGDTKEDVVTKALGRISDTIALARSSCAGLR